MNHGWSKSAVVISFFSLWVWEWPCDRFRSMRFKGKFLNGAPGKSFIFLINTNNLDWHSHSPTPFSCLGCRHDAWNTADRCDHEMTSVSTEIHFLRELGQKSRKTLGLWQHNETVLSSQGCFGFLLHERNFIYLSYHLLGFLLPAAYVLGWAIWNFSWFKNSWKSKVSFGSINIMNWCKLHDYFTSSSSQNLSFPSPLPPKSSSFCQDLWHLTRGVQVN